MNTFFIAIISLITYVLLWLILNLLAYFISIALKTQKIFSAFSSIAFTVYYIFNFLVGIWLIWLGISLLTAGHFLWFIIYLFIGASIIGFLINLLQMPFIYLTAYFSEKINEKDFDENITTAEIIGEKGKVIKRIEGDTAILVRLAKYFVLLYLLNFASIFLNPEKHAIWRWGDYILWPSLWLISQAVVVGILYIIYHKIRFKSFFPEDKRHFFIQVFKICFFFVLIATILVYGLLYFFENKTLSDEQEIQKSISQRQSNAVYDISSWESENQINEDVNGDNETEEIYYLKSIKPAGVDAADRDEFGVKIIVAKDRNVLFEYSPSEDKATDKYWPVGYYRPDTNSSKNFYLDDLSGDRLPEIIVQTGITGASDVEDCLNIISYNKTNKTFNLVNKEEFCYTFNTGIKFDNLSSLNGRQIIKAVPLNGEIAGNKVEQSFSIDVYSWYSNNFSILKKFKSSRSYEGGSNALDGEIYLIRKYFWNLSSDDLKILQTDQVVRDLQTKADAYRQMIELNKNKAQTLANQINLMDEQLNNPSLSENERMKMKKEKDSIVQQTREQEEKYQQLLERVNKQKNELLNDINKMESGVKL